MEPFRTGAFAKMGFDHYHGKFVSSTRQHEYIRIRSEMISSKTTLINRIPTKKDWLLAQEMSNGELTTVSEASLSVASSPNIVGIGLNAAQREKEE